MPTFYRVSITSSQSSAPQDGFIDNTTIEQYMTPELTGLTVVHTKAKERANIRYGAMVDRLNEMTNVDLHHFIATGANAKTAPDPFVFTLEIEHGDTTLRTADEANAGQFLTGVNAIKRCIARGLIIETTNAVADYYDPTTSAAPGNTNLAARRGIRQERIQVSSPYVNLAGAAATVTVAKIDTIGD